METNITDFNSLEQGLAGKVSELEAQRLMRETLLVDITLEAIANGVVSKEQDIIQLMSGKQWQAALREIVIREVKRAADERLWCREYDEKAKSNQRMLVYTGSHWEAIESQQWLDFVNLCAERCGVPESLRVNHVFMKGLYEGVGFNLSKNRRCLVPDGEVWINVRNGTLVVGSDGSVRLRDHRKEDLFTHTLPYVYDAQAECPLWLQFLDRSATV